MGADFKHLADKLRAILAQSLSRSVKAAHIADAIREDGPYRWVGLYDVDVKRGLVSNIALERTRRARASVTFATCSLQRVAYGPEPSPESRTVNVGDVESGSGLPAPHWTTSTRSEIICSDSGWGGWARDPAPLTWRASV